MSNLRQKRQHHFRVRRPGTRGKGDGADHIYRLPTFPTVPTNTRQPSDRCEQREGLKAEKLASRLAANHSEQLQRGRKAWAVAAEILAELKT